MTVHNHGSEEGEGLACAELRLPDGSLKGACLMNDSKKIDVRENVLDHVFKLFSEDLKICGCGDPHSAYDLIRDLLELAPIFSMDNMIPLVGSNGARYFILGQLNNAELIEHGFVIDYAGLTRKGKWYLEALGTITDWPELEIQEEYSIGLPHDGVQCTDECWESPIS